MNKLIRVALAQTNPTVGDLPGNVENMTRYIHKAEKIGADLVVFPELAITGYPPEDLLDSPSFIRKTRSALEKLAGTTRRIVALVGAPFMDKGVLYNSAVFLANGRIVGMARKAELPNYGVFDERRYFTPGGGGPLLELDAVMVGVSVCEDIWTSNTILDDQVAKGARILANISSSPYRLGAREEREKIVSAHAKRLGVPIVYCNQVGGQDELVFDGGSFAVDRQGEVTARAKFFTEDFLTLDIDIEPAKCESAGRDTIKISSGAGPVKSPLPQVEKRKPLQEDEEVYEALTLGVRDYVIKNRFTKVVIALSGGVDSALACAIAVDALGAGNVRVVFMPSPYSSGESETDARRLAKNLGLEMITLPITGLMAEYGKTLADVFKGKDKDITEENIQARIRGALIMALSNKFGWLALATGNKSELAVGYCTLYGDMVGGFAVIKDLFKTKVYRLCQWRNKKAGRDLIPRSIMEKAPSAELRPGQADTDSLPPYDELDPILREYIEHDRNVDEIEKLGYSRQAVLEITKMVDRSEYKRRQGPVGVKITPKAFGKDRRRPITCKFIDE